MAVRARPNGELPFELTDDLPPFANEANRQLDRQLKDQQAALARLSAQLEDNEARTTSMHAHLKNVKQELQHAQALHGARKREIETEDHLKQLADRETGRLVVELRAGEKAIAQLTDKLATLQGNIHEQNEKLARVKQELKMEREQELEEWLKVQSEKEEDRMALMKYSREDNIRIRDLSLQIERLDADVRKRKAALGVEVTETQGAQLELERSTQAFKQLHEERQTLIQQWERAVREMQEKDQELERTQGELLRTRGDVRQLQERLQEQEAFLGQQQTDNAASERQVHDLERGFARLRLDQQQTREQLVRFEDELGVLQGTLSKASADLRGTRSETGYLVGELEAKRAQVDQERATNKSVRDRIRAVMETTASKEQRAHELHELLRQEEQRGRALDKELKALKEFQFKRNQELHQFRNTEKNLQAELTGGRATVHNLSGKLSQLEAESQKQQALIYAQEFHLQQLERTVRRAQGDRTDEEKEILMAKIAQLTERLESETRKHGLLSTQVKRSHDELRYARKLLDDLSRERGQLVSQIDDLTLFIDGTNTRLAAKTREKEGVLVDQNILQLELRRLRGFLNNRADQLFTLKSRQLELRLAMEERTQEIGTRRDLLQMQLKQASEQRASARAELRERTTKIERLRNRYELLMVQMSAGYADDAEAAGAEGEQHTQAYYVIKAAQRREELQNEGDALDSKIRQAEREIRALENTLKLMDDRQAVYRTQLQQADLDSTDVAQRDVLQQQYEAAMQKYHEKRGEVAALQDELGDLERTLAMLGETEAGKLQAISAWEKQMYALDKGELEQDQKRQRARGRLAKLVREWRRRRNGPIDTMTPEEVELELRLMKDCTHLVLARLEEIVQDLPEVAAFLHDQYRQADIRAPSRPVTRGGAAAPSASRNASLYSLRSHSVASSASYASSVRSSAPHSRAQSVASVSSVASARSTSSAQSTSSAHFDASALPKTASSSRSVSRASLSGSRGRLAASGASVSARGSSRGLVSHRPSNV